MKRHRFATASWMLVPFLLVVPTLIAGLSLWFSWGPQWLGLTIVLAGALLALLLDYRLALRYGLMGAVAGLLTCPLLLLQDNHAWYMFATWISGISVLPALLVPLLINPPPQRTRPRDMAQMGRAESEKNNSFLASSGQGD